MSCYSTLKISTHFITSLSCARSLFCPFLPHVLLGLPAPIHLLSLSPCLSLRVRPSLSARSPFQGMAVGKGRARGRRVGQCQSSQNCSVETQRVAVEIGSHMAKLDLLSLSPLLPFIISLSASACLSLSSCSPRCCFFHSALP